MIFFCLKQWFRGSGCRLMSTRWSVAVFECSCFIQRALVINSLLVSFDPQWCVLCFVWTVCLRATVFGFSGTRRLQQIVNILDRKQVTHIILNWKYVTTLSAISPSKGLILKSRDTTSTWTGSYVIHYVLCDPLGFTLQVCFIIFEVNVALICVIQIKVHNS